MSGPVRTVNDSLVPQAPVVGGSGGAVGLHGERIAGLRHLERLAPRRRGATILPGAVATQPPLLRSNSLPDTGQLKIWIQPARF